MGYWDIAADTAQQTSNPDDVTTPTAAAALNRPESLSGVQIKDAQKILGTGYFKVGSQEEQWLQQAAAIWAATGNEAKKSNWWTKTTGAIGAGFHALGVPLDYVQHGLGTAFYVADKADTVGATKDESEWHSIKRSWGNVFNGNSWGPVFDKSTWKDGWNQSKVNSPGQIFWKPDDVEYGDDLNAYGKTNQGRLVMGTTDLLVNVFLDPTIIGGKLNRARKTAKVTVKAGETADVVKAAEAASKSDDALKALDVSKGAARKGAKMDSFIRRTDGLNESQLMKLRPFAKSSDSGAVAALFADANSIDDDVARWAAKRDIMASAMGDSTALDRLATKRADLAAKVTRLAEKPEITAKPSVLTDEGGQMSWDFFNSPNKLAEIGGLPQVEEELAKLNRLNELSGTVRTVGNPSAVDRGIEALRVRKAATDKTFYDGRLGRTVTVIGAKAGVHVKAPNAINVADATSGTEDLEAALKNAKWVDRQTRVDLLNRFARAATRRDRANAVAKAESAMLEGLAQQIAKEDPTVNIDNVRSLIAKGRDTRGKWRDGLGSSRLYSGAPENVTMAVGPDGQAFAWDKPFLQSMITDTADFMDPKAAEKALRYATKTRAVDMLDGKGADALTRVGDVAESGLDAYMNTWKFAALFRPAYLGRVQLDTQLRVLSALKPALWALEATRGAVNMAKDRGGIYFDENATMTKFGPRIKNEDGTLARPRDAIKERRAQGQYRSILKRPEDYLGAAVQPARNGDELAVINRGFDNDMSNIVLDGTDKNLQRLRGTGDWTVVKTNDLLWGRNWTRAVNRQIRNSPTAMAFVRGKSPELVKRLAERQPGSEIFSEWQQFKDAYPDIDHWIAKVQAHVDHYLPGDDIKSVVANRSVNKGDVKGWFDNTNSGRRMDVHGEGYSPTNAASPLHKEYADFRRKWFEVMGDKPETLWGKHPVYNKSFRDNMKRMLEAYSADRGGLTGTGVDVNANVRGDLKKMAAERSIRGRSRMNKDALVKAIDAHDRTIPLDEINRMRRNAAKLAKRDVTDLLFDSTKMSNAGGTLKYLAPFFGAWEDTMKKWGAIFYNNPELIERANQITSIPKNTGLTYEDPKTGQKYIFIPGKLGKFFHISDEAGLRLDPESFNVIFQGDPWWLPPVNGPIQGYAVNKLAQSDPWFASKVETNPVLKFLRPYGVDNDNIVEQQMPGWMRSLWSLKNKDEDYAAAFNSVMQMEMVRYNKGLRDDPTEHPDEIQTRTRNWYLTKALLQANAPVSVRPGPSQQLQFYVDKARQYRDSGDPNWMDHFYERFPEYFPLTISLSQNETGVVASLDAQREVEKYKKALAADPSIGWALAGAENLGQDFDAGVYAYQQGKQVGDGSGTTYRGKKGALEAARQANVSKGWMDYHKVTMFLDETLKARGLTSYQQKGAEDLAAAKEEYRLALARDNQDWGAAYGQRDQSKVASFVMSMQSAWKQYPKLAQRSDMAMLQKYLQGRDMVAQALDQRGGGIDSKQNADIASWWAQFTTSLRDSDVGFGQMWDRILETDDPGKSLMGVD